MGGHVAHVQCKGIVWGGVHGFRATEGGKRKQYAIWVVKSWGGTVQHPGSGGHHG